MTYIDSRLIPWIEPPGHYGGYSKCLVTRTKDHSRVDFRLSRYPIRGRVDSHVHQTSEHVYYVISGIALVLCGGDRRVVTAGNVVFVSAGVAHSVENTGDEDLVFVVVTAPPDDLDE